MEESTIGEPPSTKPRLHVIGCGKLGRTLACLWYQQGTFELGSLICHNHASAEAAARFIGAGQPGTDPNQLPDADVFLISTPDDQIALTAESLARSDISISADTLVFHCSGSLSSEVLAPLRERGARIASVHPVKSFADPASATSSFAETICMLEGDVHALPQLEQAFEAISGRCFQIQGDKALYHAGTSIASNFLCALTGFSLSTLQSAGLSAELAQQLTASLSREALNNTLVLGPNKALTGPIARGDLHTLKRQLSSLGPLPDHQKTAFQALAQLTIDLAEQQERLSTQQLQQLRDALKGS